MEQLTTSQRSLGDEIQQIIRNFTKDSPTRKSTEEYFTSRLNRLDALWQAFESNDNKIRSLTAVPLEDDYFASDYYTKIKQLYDKYSLILSESLAQLRLSNDEKAAIGKNPTARPDEPHSSPISTKHPPQGDQQGRETLQRRQKAMMNSLARIIQGSAKDDAPTQCLQAMNKLWSQIEEIHYSIWETGDDPL